MADENSSDEILLKIKTILDESGLKKAEEGAKKLDTGVENVGKKIDYADKYAKAFTKSIIGSAAVIGAVYKVAQFMTSAFTDSIKANEGLNKKITKAGEEWGKFKSYVGDTLVSFVEQTGILDHMGETVTLIANAFNFVKTAVLVVGNVVLTAVLEPLKLVLEAVGVFSDSAKEAANIIDTMQDGFDAAAKSQIENYKWSNQILATQKDNVKVAKDRADAEKKLKEAKKKAAEEEEAYAKRIADYKRDSGMRAAEETAKGMQEISKAKTAEELDDIRNALDTEKQLREDTYARKLELLEQDKTANKEAIEELLIDKQNYEDEYTTLSDAAEAREKERGMRLSEFQKWLNTKRAQDQISTLNTIATLSTAKNKQLAAIGKAASIGQATISTYEAANKAMTSLPYPFNLVAASLTTIAGLANVASIVGVQMAKGGIVPAVTGGVQAVIGEGRSAEAVLPLNNNTYSQLGTAVANNMGSGKQSENTGATVIVQIYASGGLVALMEQMTEAARNGVVEALQFCNISYKVGSKENGIAV